MPRIELNGEGEHVWLTPHLRDPQPEGERAFLSYSSFWHSLVSTGLTAVPGQMTFFYRFTTDNTLFSMHSSGQRHGWRWPERFGWSFEAKWATQSPVTPNNRSRSRLWTDSQKLSLGVTGGCVAHLSQNGQLKREGHGQSIVHWPHECSENKALSFLVHGHTKWDWLASDNGSDYIVPSNLIGDPNPTQEYHWLLWYSLRLLEVEIKPTRQLLGSKTGADCRSPLQHGHWVQNTEENKLSAPNSDLYPNKTAIGLSNESTICEDIIFYCICLAIIRGYTVPINKILVKILWRHCFTLFIANSVKLPLQRPLNKESSQLKGTAYGLIWKSLLQ